VQESIASQHNQLLYREVNRRIREVSDFFGSDENVEFVCECGNGDCIATFKLAQGQLDGLLKDPSHHLLAAEHSATSYGGQVLAEYETFFVVVAEAAHS
jgi:hypothetical protein